MMRGSLSIPQLREYAESYEPIHDRNGRVKCIRIHTDKAHGFWYDIFPKGAIINNDGMRTFDTRNVFDFYDEMREGGIL